MPKTLIFAKDDTHADDIVQIVREEFGKGNDFCQKITYRTTGIKPEDLLAQFRNNFNPRIVVTVDMIATGTDVKPIEIVMFMRTVKSAGYFEQMKGRGVRVMPSDDLKRVSGDATAKTHFVIVDAVGVTEQEMIDSPPPMERQRSVAFGKLVERVAWGQTDEATLSSLAFRLSKLDKVLTPEGQTQVATLSGGQTLGQIVQDLLRASDPDARIDHARAASGLALDEMPSDAQIAAAKERPGRAGAGDVQQAGPAERPDRIAGPQRAGDRHDLAGRGAGGGVLGRKRRNGHGSRRGISAHSSRSTATRSRRCRCSTAARTGNG